LPVTGAEIFGFIADYFPVSGLPRHDFNAARADVLAHAVLFRADMMSVHSIVVDVDAAAPEHPALQHAVALAARCQASVKIVDVLPYVPESARGFVTPVLEAELVEHRRACLARIAEPTRDVPVTTELLRGRAATALIQEVLRSGHDLVVRSHGRDLSDTARPFGAVDMELLRQCPCPVWLVNRRAPLHVPLRVVAAIHANPDEPTEQALNATILDWALILNGDDAAGLTVLQAWTPYGASLLRSRMSSDEFAEFVESARATEHNALLAFLEQYGRPLTGMAVELVRGEPDDAVADFVESHGIDVVVMGTVARTGLAGVVMGNTAERVLRRLRGSVLAVKPPGLEARIASSGRGGAIL
jgi:nucleotide-binding universal stress UspA family protein